MAQGMTIEWSAEQSRGDCYVVARATGENGFSRCGAFVWSKGMKWHGEAERIVRGITIKLSDDFDRYRAGLPI